MGEKKVPSPHIQHVVKGPRRGIEGKDEKKEVPKKGKKGEGEGNP